MGSGGDEVDACQEELWSQRQGSGHLARLSSDLLAGPAGLRVDRSQEGGGMRRVSQDSPVPSRSGPKLSRLAKAVSPV